MIKQITIIQLSIIAAIAVAPSVSAAPVVIEEASGVLGSPAAQMPAQDPQIRQAIEWIRSKHPQQQEQHIKKHDRMIGSHRNVDHMLILGGAEALPM